MDGLFGPIRFDLPLYPEFVGTVFVARATNKCPILYVVDSKTQFVPSTLDVPPAYLYNTRHGKQTQLLFAAMFLLTLKPTVQSQTTYRKTINTYNIESILLNR